MVRVAIAGGSGGLGRVITKAVARSGKHDVFVLSRRSLSISEQTIGVGCLTVDYSNVSQITGLLESNNIEVIISAIGIVFEDSYRAQMNLIEGASRSTTVRRFAPSEFALDYVQGVTQHVLFDSEQEYLMTNFRTRGYPFPVPGSQMYKAAEYKVETLEKLKSTQMEYTRFISGFLMDYYGYPAVPCPVLPLAVVLDVENCQAAIPTDGNSPVTLTHSETIGSFGNRGGGSRYDDSVLQQLQSLRLPSYIPPHQHPLPTTRTLARDKNFPPTYHPTGTHC
ncbi:Oxidoreductase swnN [Colletotrichum fructicola]|nr:Oxidoreductase swnN [Colletotrichum fructicola]